MGRDIVLMISWNSGNKIPKTQEEIDKLCGNNLLPWICKYWYNQCSELGIMVETLEFGKIIFSNGDVEYIIVENSKENRKGIEEQIKSWLEEINNKFRPKEFEYFEFKKADDCLEFINSFHEKNYDLFEHFHEKYPDFYSMLASTFLLEKILETMECYANEPKLLFYSDLS